MLETRGRPIVEIKPDWKAQIMTVIADPNVALILMMIGIYGILFEFWHPGAVAPGVIGAISLIVALTPRCRCCPSTTRAWRCSCSASP